MHGPADKNQNQHAHPVETEKLSGPCKHAQLLPLAQELVLNPAHGWTTGTVAGMEAYVERRPEKEICKRRGIRSQTTRINTVASLPDWITEYADGAGDNLTSFHLERQVAATP